MSKILLAAMLVVACQPSSGPPVVVSDVQVFLPLPGSTAAVAYFTINNESGAAINVSAISSPQFAVSEIHETVLRDGIATMRPVDKLTVDNHSSVSLEPGGVHLMLMKPHSIIVADTRVTLEIHYDESGLIMVDAKASHRNSPGKR